MRFVSPRKTHWARVRGVPTENAAGPLYQHNMVQPPAAEGTNLYNCQNFIFPFFFFLGKRIFLILILKKNCEGDFWTWHIVPIEIMWKWIYSCFVQYGILHYSGIEILMVWFVTSPKIPFFFISTDILLCRRKKKSHFYMCALVKHVHKLVHETAIFAGSNYFESQLFQSLLQQIALVLLGNFDILNPKYGFNPKLPLDDIIHRKLGNGWISRVFAACLLPCGVALGPVLTQAVRVQPLLVL